MAPVDLPQFKTVSPELYDETRAPGIIAGSVICQAIATLFFLARVYSRVVLLRAWRIDDWVLLAAWLLACGNSICTYLEVEAGLGRHLTALPAAQFALQQQLTYIWSLFFIVTLPATKLSICLSYYRIFGSSQKRDRYIINSMIALLVLSTIPIALVTAFQCTPISAFWTQNASLTHESCTDIRPAFYTNGICNILTDIALIAFTFPRIRALRIPTRQRVALLAVVSIGWLAVLAGCLRMAAGGRLYHDIYAAVATSADDSSTRRPDPPWEADSLSIWSAVEVHIGILCAAAPTISPLLARILPWLSSARSLTEVNEHTAVSVSRFRKSESHELATSRSATCASVVVGSEGGAVGGCGGGGGEVGLVLGGGGVADTGDANASAAAAAAAAISGLVRVGNVTEVDASECGTWIAPDFWSSRDSLEEGNEDDGDDDDDDDDDDEEDDGTFESRFHVRGVIQKTVEVRITTG